MFDCDTTSYSFFDDIPTVARTSNKTLTHTECVITTLYIV